jgi:hypothetical protein
MEKQQKKDEERATQPRDWRDHPVEQEGDKDIKEGGMEQSGRRDEKDR